MMTRILKLGAVLPTWVLLLGAPLPGHAAEKNVEALEEQAFKQAAALVNPSVVRIQTVGGLDRIGRVLTGTGPTTGVVVSKDGYIISSTFNFASKPASILVQLPDGRRFPAKIVASDRSKMLTLLKIDAKDLAPAQPADRKSFRVGQWSIALGRTYGNSFPSLSVGIVSALNRIWGKAVQTDAKVSPVNYGGPLVDVHGKVMGVLVPLSPRGSGATAGVEWYDSGIGFAIPLEDIYASLKRLKSGEDLRAGLMGITLEARDPLGGKPIIDRVRYNSPAEKAGLKSGDVIIEVDGKKVGRQAEVKHALGNKYAGEKIVVSVTRNKETIRKELTLVAELAPYESGFLGILPAREDADRESPPGVGVRYVYPDSPAAKAGLKARDRIVRLGDAEVTDAASLTNLVSRQRPDETASLVYTRGGARRTVEIPLASLPESVPGELYAAAIPPPKQAAELEKQGNSNDKAEEEKNAEENGPKTGRFTEEMPAHEHSYWAYVPEDYNPAYKYALMVWIHPNGDTMEAAVLEDWKAICDRRGIIILAPKAEKLAGFQPNEATFVKAAVEQFIEQYSIDSARVFLHGYSSGGRFAYHLAFKFRETFRGVAAAAAVMRTRPGENKPDSRLQFHLVCGDKDNAYGSVQATVKALRRMKFPVSFTTIKARAHKYPPTEEVREIGRWADCLDRI